MEATVLFWTFTTAEGIHYLTQDLGLDTALLLWSMDNSFDLRLSLKELSALNRVKNKMFLLSCPIKLIECTFLEH